jgi:hypothetical protein
MFTIKEELLIEGLQVEGNLNWIYSEVWNRLPLTNSFVRGLSLGLIMEMLTEDLVTVGNIDAGELWSGTNGDAVIRIASEWVRDWPEGPPKDATTLGPELSNTPHGDNVARSLKASGGTYSVGIRGDEDEDEDDDFPERPIMDQILIAGLDDWLDPGSVVSAVVSAPLTPELTDEESRQMGLGFVVELIAEELVVPGDMAPGWIFTPWTLSPGDALERIATTWIKEFPNETLYPGAVAWLELTPKARRRAENYLKREAIG